MVSKFLTQLQNYCYEQEKLKNNNLAKTKEESTLFSVSPQPTGLLTFCRVSVLKTGENKYFLCDFENIAVGNIVVIPINETEEKGVVLSIEHYQMPDVPGNPELTQHILRAENENGR